MFLSEPPQNDARSALYARDLANDGYVANFTRAWAWRPDVFDAFVKLRLLLIEHCTLSARERAIMVCATAANLGDSYCALAYGATLAVESDLMTAAAVLRKEQSADMSARDRAMAKWAERLVHDPNVVTPDDVEELRSAGLSEAEIFDATAFIALRIAFSTVNDALGAQPDRELAAAAPEAVREAVTYGRCVDEPASR